MAARVTEVFDNPGSTQEPLASHNLRDVPTGDHPEPPDPWFDPPPAPTGDHPEPARKILVGIGGVGGSVPGGPLVGGHGGAGGIRQPETTPADIRRMIAEELAGSDLAGSILREAARLIPQIMLGDYTHPSDSTESMDKFVQALMSARDKLAEKNYIRGRSAGGAIASKKMQPILDSLVKERDEALAKLAQVQSAVPAGMALARAEVAFHRETLIAVSKFLADRSRTAPQGT
jgi:hypothetical protein